MATPKTMMIRANKAVAGGPIAGETGEVPYDYGKLLVEGGHAIDMTELVERTELSAEERYAVKTVKELKQELEDRDLPVSGSKVELVTRLVEDDEAPEDPDDIDYRSSDSGKYVTEEYAQRHPKQTEGENYED